MAVAVLNWALPDFLVIGNRWLLGVIVFVLTVPTVWSHHSGRHNLNAILGFIVNSLETVTLVVSLGLLIDKLPSGKEKPIELLRAASCLWFSNVLVFALWYWRLDAGGPHQRDKRGRHESGEFLFPQMVIPEDDPNFDVDWQPMFVDYLFLAFNTSTALSPTDVPILSRRAKMLMMGQSVISLTVTVILAARAVNVL